MSHNTVSLVKSPKTAFMSSKYRNYWRNNDWSGLTTADCLNATPPTLANQSMSDVFIKQIQNSFNLTSHYTNIVGIYKFRQQRQSFRESYLIFSYRGYALMRIR